MVEKMLRSPRRKIPQLLLVIAFTLEISKGHLVEEQLIAHLIKNVTKFSRPVTNLNSSILSTFGIELVQLVDMNEKEQLVTTKVWVRQSWQADVLRWEPSEWQGIQRIQLDASTIWTPDIVLYNNADSTFSGGTIKYKTMINIQSNGFCQWLSPATFVSNCDIDIAEFPFDRQECELKFGSWTFDARGINLTTDDNPVVTSKYIPSSEFKLNTVRKVVNSIKYECCEYPFIDVTFTLVLSRKPLYYVFNVLAPCVFLVLAVLFGFFLPPESGERISLTITILLAVAVFLQLVSDTLPRNSDSIAMLSLFYMVMMAESTFSLITTCIVLVYHYRGLESTSAPMPKWMKRFFLERLAPILSIKRHSILKEEDDSMSVVNNLANMSRMMSILGPMRPKSDGYENESFKLPESDRCESISSDTALNVPILATILKELKIISSKVKEENKHANTQDDWMFLARVLDRLFFWLFFITVLITCLAIILPSYFVHN